jgi:hypothetical protein
MEMAIPNILTNTSLPKKAAHLTSDSEALLFYSHTSEREHEVFHEPFSRCT